MIKGILFDKDGTLLEFNSTMHYIYSNVFISLQRRYNVPDSFIERQKRALGHVTNKLHSNSLLQFSTNPQIVQVMLDTSDRYAEEMNWEIPFTREILLDLIEEHSLTEDVPYTSLPGTLEALKYLNSKNYCLGIATADTHDATITGLKKTSLFTYFSFFGTSSSISRPKPDSSMADTFCSENNITSEELLIVGDSENDMIFAENSGAQFVGISADDIGEVSVFEKNGYNLVRSISEIIDIYQL